MKIILAEGESNVFSKIFAVSANTFDNIFNRESFPASLTQIVRFVSSHNIAAYTLLPSLLIALSDVFLYAILTKHVQRRFDII